MRSCWGTAHRSFVSSECSHTVHVFDEGITNPKPRATKTIQVSIFKFGFKQTVSPNWFISVYSITKGVAFCQHHPGADGASVPLVVWRRLALIGSCLTADELLGND